MATHIFNGGALYLGQIDFSPITKSLAIDTEVDAVDMTVMTQTTRVMAAGLVSNSWASEMLFDPGYESALSFWVSEVLPDNQDTILSYYPSGAAAQDETCYFGRARVGSLKRLGPIGEAAMMVATGQTAELGAGVASQNLVAGRLSCRGVAAAATVTGTGRQLGALASERAYALMSAHVTAITGTASIVFTLQSDDNSGFTTPTTRGTLTAITGSANWGWLQPVPGPITDDYWRVVGTITGTGTVTFRANMGHIVLP